MPDNYPWYEIVEGEELWQGDFIKECPILVPPKQLTDYQETEVENYDVVVMSQSCDLTQKKIDLVLVCPFWSLDQMGNVNVFFKGVRGKESLRRGDVPGYHLLNKSNLEGFETDFLVVDFRNVYGVPISFLTELARSRGKRLRLMPPYREHLSQAFARFFMRVGLPVDIPAFK